jgi:D-glycero-alpha-D-manno-heptose-7-phosphate kinase
MTSSADHRARPVLRARSPLRISFAGGGTDVAPFPEREGGAVLSSTISAYCFVTLRPRTDGRITVQSLDYGSTIAFGADDEIEFDGQLDLPKAAIARVRTIAGTASTSGFDLFIHTNAPPGSGLGSSSAVMVAIIGVVAEHLGVDLTPYETAELAFRLEREDLAIPGGAQDQYAAAFGGFNFIEFGADGVVVNPLRVRDATVHELEHNMLLAFTGKTRVSDHIISDQVSRYESGNDAALEGLRAQKVLAHKMKDALVKGEVDTIGHLLGEAWTQKRKMSDRISTPIIDEAIERAMRLGALGGKVTGAGGGGFLTFICEFERRHIVAAELAKMGLTVSEFTFAKEGLVTWRAPR